MVRSCISNTLCQEGVLTWHHFCRGIRWCVAQLVTRAGISVGLGANKPRRLRMRGFACTRLTAA